MADDIKDTTKVDVTNKTGDDKGESSSIDKGEFEKAQAGSKALSSLLEDHGYDSKEDLIAALSDNKDLRDKVGDAKIDDLMAKAKTLDSYEQYWASQDTKAKREDETPDERVDRLEKRLDASETAKRQEALKQSQLEENQKALDSFGTEIKDALAKGEATPEEYRAFMSEFLGVNNPANEVDITNQADVRNMAKGGVQKVQDFEQAVIKRYRDGKIKVPEITPVEPIDVDSIKEKQPKNLAEARQIATEVLQKQFSGRT